MPRIVLLSDTHQHHRTLTIPDGDVLVHCGDWTNQGTPEAVTDFGAWLRAQPHAFKVLIAGNHDRCLDRRYPLARGSALRELAGSGELLYLEDSGVEILGLRFWGSPWTPPFFDWAFMVPSAQRARYWSMIPDDTDVLITHGPPFGLRDWNASGERCGDPELAKRVFTLPALKLHAFGHIHEGYGRTPARHLNGAIHTAVNAATCTGAYRPTNPPIVVDL